MFFARLRKRSLAFAVCTISFPLLLSACGYRPPNIPKDAKRIHAGFWQTRTADLLITYYPDGKIYQKGQLKNGVPHGLWQYFSHAGQVTTSGLYQNGLRTGKWIFRNSNGGLYQEIQYASEPKRLDYLLLSGNKVGNENGPYRRYYEDGRLEEEGSYVGGSKHGLFRRYYPNGALASRGAYKADQKEGPWIYYYPDGAQKRKEFYHSGRLSGRLVNLYPDGRLYNQSLYENGLRKGEARIFPNTAAYQNIE